MHEPVMVKEVLDALCARPGGTYIDGTLGGGGHAEAVLRAMRGSGRFLGLDRDAAAVTLAAARLEQWRDLCRLKQIEFARLDQAWMETGWDGFVDGVLLDLGISSNQIEAPERGFSFRQNGPLDMRMDINSSGPTAADLVNTMDVGELERIFREYGEESGARRVARAIEKERKRQPILETQKLADLVAGALSGKGYRRIHPATRIFQALRIAVNQELDELEQGLEAALRVLAPGGRLVVLSYHSLEDRRVKICFREHAGRRESLAEGGWKWMGTTPQVRIVTRRPLVPSADEELKNPRARSAKLRVAERMVS